MYKKRKTYFKKRTTRDRNNNKFLIERLIGDEIKEKRLYYKEVC